MAYEVLNIPESAGERKLSKRLLGFVDGYLVYTRMPAIVTSGYREGDKGQHGKGNALDVVVDLGMGSGIDAILSALRFNFTGLGVYPDWKIEGVKRTLGFHFDVREKTPLEPSARWLHMRIDGKIEKYALNYSNLLKFEVANGLDHSSSTGNQIPS